MLFAEKLQKLRAEAGLTQFALAEKAGVSLGAIRNYEQGLREPYWDVALRLARALGVQVETFAGGVRGQAKPPAKKRKGK